MKKKSSARSPGLVNFKKTPASSLDEIQKKLASSSALNGGFDTLLFKIDKIEQSQGQLVNKVDKIHEAIYDPTDGIFSRLSEYKLESTNKINEVSQNLTEIQVWREVKDKEGEKDDQKNDKNDLKLESLEKSVDSLVRNKNNVWSVMKWFLVAVGGGLVTLTIKWLETKI